MQVILAVRSGQAKTLSFRHPNALVIDCDGRTTWRNGLWLKVTPQQSRIFFAIALRRGGPMEKSELCDVLWGDDEDGGPVSQWRMIDAHLCKLRKALPSVGVTIRTDWDRGFRLTEVEELVEIDLRRAA